MSSQKPFNWDNPRENTIPQIKQEGLSLGVRFDPKDKKPQMLEKLIIAKSGMENTFQQSMSATNSPRIPTASNLIQGSKTPNVTSKKAKGRPPKKHVDNDTFINPILLGGDESNEQSPIIQQIPTKNQSKIEKTEKIRLEPLPQQEIVQAIPEKHSPQQIPERHSPSPQQHQERHSPSPQQYQERHSPPPQQHQERHSPPPQQHQERHSPTSQRVPTPERNPSSSWSPSPVRKHTKKRASRTPSPPIKYGSGYSSDYEYDDRMPSSTLSTIYHCLPYVLIVLLILSCIHPPLSGLLIILLIYYFYLRSKYNNQKSRKNIQKY